MSIAWDNVEEDHPSQSDYMEPEPQSPDGDSHTPREANETVDLLSEVYVTVAVAMPIILLILGITMTVLNEGSIAFTLPITPAVSTVTSLIVGGLLIKSRPSDSNTQLYSVIIMMSVLVCLTVAAILLSQFVTPVADIEPSFPATAVREYVLLTIAPIATIGGGVAGYLSAGRVRDVPIGAILGIAVTGILFLL